MAQQEIPKAWCKSVCAILATEATGKLIEWTVDAVKRYEADAAAVKICAGENEAAWQNEVYQPFRDFLASPHPLGCPVTMERPAGETYEFYFPFRGATFYGKIFLRTDQKRVVIYSAHRPLKEKLSCE
jgi:hypothetical protein